MITTLYADSLLSRSLSLISVLPDALTLHLSASPATAEEDE